MSSSVTHERERGTLHHTLPRRPIILIVLVGVAASLLAVGCFRYSMKDDAYAQLGDEKLRPFQDELWWMYLGIASMGSLPTLTGIVMGDTLLQSFVLGVMILVLGTALGEPASAIRAASPSLLFSVLASIEAIQPIFSILASILFRPFIVQSILGLQCIMFLLQSTSATSSYDISLLPTFTVTLLTLALLYGYIQNRSHKHGSLLLTLQKTQTIPGTACIALSIYTMHQFAPLYGLLFTLGSLWTLAMSTTLAAIADVWYPIGSGQFQMICLDTIGMMIYFMVPATLLGMRFVSRYGEDLGSAWREIVGSFVHLNLGMNNLGNHQDNLAGILSLTTAIGAAVINVLCPMGGYLFARSYTHGQPNTKKVAVCVQYSHLEGVTESYFKALEAKKVVLNIFVTFKDIESNSEKLKELDKKGHHIALASSRTLGSFTGLSFMQTKNVRSSIETACNEYNNLFGTDSTWVLADSAISRHPAYLRKAHDLGMKVAYWSTLVEVNGSNLSEEQKALVMDDVIDKNGGSVVYVTSKNEALKGSISTAVTTIVNALDGFSIESLSQVVKDDSPMIL